MYRSSLVDRLSLFPSRTYREAYAGLYLGPATGTPEHVRKDALTLRQAKRPALPNVTEHDTAVAGISESVRPFRIGASLDEVKAAVAGRGGLQHAGNMVLVQQYVTVAASDLPGDVLLYFHQEKLFCVQVRFPVLGDRGQRARFIDTLARTFGGKRMETSSVYFEAEYSNSVEMGFQETSGVQYFTRGQWFYVRDHGISQAITQRMEELFPESWDD